MNVQNGVVPDPEHNPDGTWRGPHKLVRRRDYSGGSLRDRICRATTEGEVMALGALATQLYEEGRLSTRAWRKIDQAGKATMRRLENGLIEVQPLLVAPDGSVIA